MRRDYNKAAVKGQEAKFKEVSSVAPLPRAGVFTDRFLVRDGEFAGMMEKRLHGVVGGKTADEHISAMEWYVKTLRKMGARVADTVFRKIPAGRGFSITLYQEKFEDAELVTNIIRTGGKEECLAVFERTLLEGVKAIDYKREYDVPKKDELGFHSSLRNWAMRGGEMFFLDLTPPLRRVDGNTCPLTFLKHIPARFKFIPSLRMRDIIFRIASRDSFDMRVMLAGCLASAVSRRREFETDLRCKTIEIIEKCIPASERNAYLEKITGDRLSLHRKINRTVRNLFRS
jgi:hypothetical protein